MKTHRKARNDYVVGRERVRQRICVEAVRIISRELGGIGIGSRCTNNLRIEWDISPFPHRHGPVFCVTLGSVQIVVTAESSPVHKSTDSWFYSV